MSELRLDGLCVERGGRRVVKEVSIAVPAGEVTAVLGPNGAGKSSMVLAVGGVLRPRPGSVTLDGVELAGRRPEKIRAAGVAIVPEGPPGRCPAASSRWWCSPRRWSRSRSTS
jgi:branched-chain amino acid transport system ATP-binding protein